MSFLHLIQYITDNRYISEWPDLTTRNSKVPLWYFGYIYKKSQTLWYLAADHQGVGDSPPPPKKKTSFQKKKYPQISKKFLKQNFTQAAKGWLRRGGRETGAENGGIKAPLNKVPPPYFFSKNLPRSCQGCWKRGGRREGSTHSNKNFPTHFFQKIFPEADRGSWRRGRRMGGGSPP